MLKKHLFNASATDAESSETGLIRFPFLMNDIDFL